MEMLIQNARFFTISAAVLTLAFALIIIISKVLKLIKYKFYNKKGTHIYTRPFII